MRALGSRTMLTAFSVRQQTLIVDLGEFRSVLSSAPRGGGVTRARYILNHQVAAQPIGRKIVAARCGDPARALTRLAIALGIRAKFVGLMTAVSLAELVTVREVSGQIWVEGFVTVGTSNAVRAGEPATVRQGTSSCAHPGTINVILVTNARLSRSAMVGMVQVATEAKTSVLLREKVKSWTGRPGATGTGTDAVVAVSGNGPPLRYSGTHTILGELVGRAVETAVTKGLARYLDWQARRTAHRSVTNE
ncbi:MAG: adenosylcobinamide amidohydrolase [Nitrospiraceae bacterium]